MQSYRIRMLYEDFQPCVPGDGQCLQEILVENEACSNGLVVENPKQHEMTTLCLHKTRIRQGNGSETELANPRHLSNVVRPYAPILPTPTGQFFAASYPSS